MAQNTPREILAGRGPTTQGRCAFQQISGSSLKNGSLREPSRTVQHITRAKQHGGDISPHAIDHEMTMVDHLASLGAIFRQTHAENHIVQTQFQRLKQVKTGQTTCAACIAEIAAELAFENAINAARFLLCAQLASVVRYTLVTAALVTFAVLPGAKPRFSKEHFGLKQRSPFKNNFSPSRRHSLHTGPIYLAILFPLLYTRRFFGGRQPLCGTGVISEIERTLMPIDCTARMADSRPGPGPLTIKSTSCMPIDMAAFIACSAARRAAKGVLLREPLKPADPELPQQTALPWLIGHRDDRVVERRKHMHLSAGQCALYFSHRSTAATRRAYVLCHSSFLSTSNQMWALNNPVRSRPSQAAAGERNPLPVWPWISPRLLLCSPATATATGNSLLRTLARAGIGARALSMHRQVAAMAQTTVATDFDQPLDVHLHFTAQITFNLVVLAR